MVTMWMGPRPAATSLMMQWLRKQVGMGRWVRCEASGSRYSLPTIFCNAGNHLDSYSSPRAFCVYVLRCRKYAPTGPYPSLKRASTMRFSIWLIFAPALIMRPYADAEDQGAYQVRPAPS